MPYPGLDLAGKVAVVIGGTAGIGRALAHALAEAGADVVATGRRPERVAEAAQEIEALGRRTLRVNADVTDEPSLQGLFQATLGPFRNFDILANSAGRPARARPPEGDEAAARAVLGRRAPGTPLARPL